ncbi:hypothetical protein [Limnochorda pilosa]|uniref:Uncharacterized protein n=1 Tax=Limnochorda pilosa TaxID=1555112 RepID=A0A0K2SMI4_LIMPI|nr:hypothetical protein [Limnochorda pilosa]BAS28207.1 hypothetical protein LIP_2366 [Limnochorda pilosa]
MNPPVLMPWDGHGAHATLPLHSYPAVWESNPLQRTMLEEAERSGTVYCPGVFKEEP